MILHIIKKTITENKNKKEKVSETIKEIKDETQANKYLINFAMKKLQKLSNEWGIEIYIPTGDTEHTTEVFEYANITFNYIGENKLKTYQYKFKIE